MEATLLYITKEGLRKRKSRSLFYITVRAVIGVRKFALWGRGNLHFGYVPPEV